MEWEHNESDPRFIYYKEGEDRFTDDHFSMQHSRYLTEKEIKDIYFILKRVYHIDKFDTMPIV